MLFTYGEKRREYLISIKQFYLKYTGEAKTHLGL
jgi:hypothetical protein